MHPAHAQRGDVRWHGLEVRCGAARRGAARCDTASASRDTSVAARGEEQERGRRAAPGGRATFTTHQLAEDRGPGERDLGFAQMTPWKFSRGAGCVSLLG